MKEILFLVPYLLTCLLAGAQKRYALIIGNSNYKSQNVLKNPLSDVRLLGTSLRDCGFEVDKREDISRKDLLNALNQFYEKIKSTPCIALFYYSGHGVQYEGENFMIPVDAQIQGKSDIEFDCVALGRVLGYMEESQSITNIIILDACRKDPFANAFYRGEGDKGLAVVRKTPHESYIAFATAPGEVANDGSDNNSPFTKALAKHIVEPGVNIEAVFKRVNNDVKKQYPKQVPWTNSSLGIDFYFKDANGANSVAKQGNNEANEKNNDNTGDRSVANISTELRTALEKTYNNMQTVEGNSFEMGTSGGNNDESPVHRVEISSFYFSKYEVTQGLWKVVMKNNPADKECLSCPVTNVTWNDVHKFIDSLNKLTGEKYRLPTEAEWEYAARGGKLKKSNKFSGASRLDKFGWSYENADGKLQPVGKLTVNESGLFDMSGNAAEWCSDWYDAAYYRRSDQLKDPKGPPTGKTKVVRGGSSEDYEANCKVFTRGNYAPISKSKFIGVPVGKMISINIYENRNPAFANHLVVLPTSAVSKPDRNNCRWSVCKIKCYNQHQSSALSQSNTTFGNIYSYFGGITYDIKITNEFSIRSELLYIKKGWTETSDYRKSVIEPGSALNIGNNTLPLELTSSRKTYEINYLQLPVHATFYTPIGKSLLAVGVGPYVSFGLKGKYNFKSLSSSKYVTVSRDTTVGERSNLSKIKIYTINNIKDYISDSTETISFTDKTEKSTVYAAYRFDYGASLKASLELRMGLSINAGYSFGLTNVLRTNYGILQNRYRVASAGLGFTIKKKRKKTVIDN